MKAELDLDKIDQLPPSLRKLLPKPESKKVSFEQLNDTNIEKAVNYVKTKTLMDLFNQPRVGEKKSNKGEKPIVLVFCQPSEEINIQKN